MGKHSDDSDQLRRRGAFEPVAEGAKLERLPNIFIFVEGGEHKNTNPGVALVNHTGGRVSIAHVNGDSAAIAIPPERQLALTTARGQFITDFYKRYAEHTPTKSLALIAQVSHPNGTKNLYRAVTHRGNNIVTIVMPPTGLVHSIGLSTDDSMN